MIRIQVIACNGAPPLHPLSAEFDELGGNIGRAESNALVLYDPARNISRVHASIAFRAGEFFICSLGSATPVYLNDHPMNNGQDESIAAGDKIRIGDYTMQVVGEKRVFDSTSDTGSTTVQEANLETQSAGYDSDPFAALDVCSFGDSPQIIVSPKEMISESSIMNKVDPLAMNADFSSAEMIPSDFDPFAASLASSGVLKQAFQTEPQKQDNLGLGLVAPISKHEIDNFINPNNSLDNLSKQADVDSVDPLVVMSGMPEKKIATNPVQRDDLPELQGSYHPPKVKDDIIEVPLDADNNNKMPASDNYVAGLAGSEEELLRAFLVGAGVPDLDMSTKLTPQMMNSIGQLLRASTQGTLDLLLARSLTKREMRAEATLIVPRENNPLKFSPNVEAALAHLLAPKGRGFMTPLQAMKDAHDDLCSHQFGFMAGMRAALAGVLERFNPQKLEQRLTQKTFIDSLLPMSRRAKLWELFTARYSDISHEAEEDFHVLFGKEFLRAYEAQIAKLEQDDGKI